MKPSTFRERVTPTIAAVVDEADSVQEALLEPAAYGLDLICRGIRRTSKNDKEALGRGSELVNAADTDRLDTNPYAPGSWFPGNDDEGPFLGPRRG